MIDHKRRLSRNNKAYQNVMRQEMASFITTECSKLVTEQSGISFL